jgi:hypothetical protein
MLSAALITVSLILGYLVVIAFTMASVFTIATLHPHFPVENHRLRKRYKLLQSILWFVFAFIGGYMAIRAAAEASPLLASGLLAVILVFALWSNPTESKQRGLLHMLLASASIVAGISAAYAVTALKLR